MKRLFLALIVTTVLVVGMAGPAYANSLPDPQDNRAVILPDEGDTATQEEPSAIGKVIGTLGLYAAMMAVLSVGTEVIIDAVRPIFGLKRKTTTSEALGKLKEWLPSTLEELEIGSEALQQIDEKLEKLEKVTGKLDNAHEELKKYKEQLIGAARDAGIEAARKMLDDNWDTWQGQIKTLIPGVEKQTLIAVRAWLEKGLENPYETICNLLHTVRERRKQFEGILAPLGKIWRWLRQVLVKCASEKDTKVWGKVCAFLLWLEFAWLWLRDRVPGGKKFRQWRESLQETGQQVQITLQDAFEQILTEDGEQQDRETLRITWLRVISVIVGIALASMLAIDSLQLLQPILGQAAYPFQELAVDEAGNVVDTRWLSIAEIAQRAKAERVKTDTESAPDDSTKQTFLRDWFSWFLSLTPGIILSGLGAAAGSNFWHDQLDRLRNIKETVEPAEKMLKQLKQSGSAG